MSRFRPQLKSPWKRKGLYYEAHRVFRTTHGPVVGVKRLDFLSYHLIRWIHGEEALIEMASRWRNPYE